MYSLCCEPVRTQTGLKWRESSGERCGSLRLEREEWNRCVTRVPTSLGVALLCRPFALARSGARAATA